MDRHSIIHAAIVVMGVATCGSLSQAADPPCDKYPPAKQARCVATWKELNNQDANSIAAFGLAQQKRREEGKLTAEQHLSENMTFIKQSTEKRLQRLADRMAKE